LNKGEIPSTGSLVEVFNKAIFERCLKVYNERMGRAGLPVSVDKLQQFHDLAKDEARRLFDKQHFGKHHAAQSILKLDEEIKKVFHTFCSFFYSVHNKILSFAFCFGCKGLHCLLQSSKFYVDFFGAN
jgi:hypothetical protein